MASLHPGLWLQADARRGRSGPRKPSKARRAWRVLEVSPTAEQNGERGRVGRESDEQTLQSASVGAKTRSAGCTNHSIGGFPTMYEDKTLVCRDCGAEFVFTAGEQEFYAEKASRTSPPVARIAAPPARRTALPLPAKCTRRPVPLAARRPPCPSFRRAIVPSIAASALQLIVRLNGVTKSSVPHSRGGAFLFIKI